jgi:hypothetical protein
LIGEIDSFGVEVVELDQLHAFCDPRA